MMNSINFTKPLMRPNNRAFIWWCSISIILTGMSATMMIMLYGMAQQQSSSLFEEQSMLAQRQQSFDSLEQELIAAKQERDQMKTMHDKAQKAEQQTQQQQKFLALLQTISATMKAQLTALTLDHNQLELSLSASTMEDITAVYEKLLPIDFLSTLVISKIHAKNGIVQATIKGTLA